MDSFHGNYYYDVIANPPSGAQNKGKDYAAFKIGYSDMMATKRAPFFSVIRSGSLPGSESHIQSYIGVYERGLKEKK